jgi:hypothetical protein
VRAQSSEDAPSRILSPFVDPYYAFAVGGFLGDGIGSTHQAAEKLEGPAPLPRLAGSITGSGADFEGESGKIMVELGLVGFLLIYAARIAIVFLALRYISLLKRPALRGLGTASLLLLIVSLPGSVVFNVTGGLLYWFFVGILFAVVRFDRLAAVRETSPVRTTEMHRQACRPTEATVRPTRAPFVVRR